MSGLTSPKGRKDIMKLLPTIVIAAVLVLALIAGYLTVQKIIVFQAVDNCLSVGKATFKNSGGQLVTVPDEYWFKYCMKEKKLK